VKLKLAKEYEGGHAKIEVRHTRVKDRFTYWLEKKQELEELINKRAKLIAT
jgi:transcription initiation factor TFIID subunit TAF12